ncbi:partial Inner membrane protein YjgN, partial [Burkholderiales bacterium]
MNLEASAAALPLPDDLVPEAATSAARDQTPVAASAARTLELKFEGKSGEYFRIWIVNLFLTVATLGIFSAWAKVRKKRYLYAHTSLDGTPFQYLGQPLPILKGRLIAAALFLLYYFTSNFFTAQFIYVIVAAALLAPWVVVGSAAFQTRYSSFRNLTFRFAGSYRSAFAPVTCYGLLLLAAVGMGLAARQQNPFAMVGALSLISLFFPLWQQRTRAYVVHHTSFGGHPGIFTARARSYYKIFFLA